VLFPVKYNFDSRSVSVYGDEIDYLDMAINCKNHAAFVLGLAVIILYCEFAGIQVQFILC